MLCGLMAVLHFCLPAASCRAESAPRLYQRASAIDRPAGAPAASDVIMRSLGLHPRNDQDPHDTMQALRDFHATTLAWAYITDPEFIARVQASGRVFGGAAAAPSYIPPAGDEPWFQRVVIVDLDGQPIIAPWKRTWTRTLWGCVNNPELERGYAEYLQRYIDAGAQIMQRDEPGANLNATRWGGCFCDHCMERFRQYLAEHTTAATRQGLGIEDLDGFDYRQHLRSAGAPVGDAFGNWNGGELKELFVEFQTEATVAFHRRAREAIDRYAGRRVPFSCNNGVRLWTEVELGFDWAFGELAYRHATADYLYAALRTAAEHDRGQIVTMPKKSNYDNPEEWQQRTRRTIAMSYACGGQCMVPWDVYMPGDAPRYFGQPAQYADLFGFIRAASGYLDGYQHAAAAGYGVPEPGDDAVVHIAGAPQVSAIVRAVPDDPEAAVVVHLVDWSDDPQPCHLQLDPAAFFGDRPLQIRLLRPAPYEREQHAAAEQTGEFPALSREEMLATGYVTSVQLPALEPWGILVVEPQQGDVTSGVWQPRIWADEASCFADQLLVNMDCASTDAVVRYTSDGSEPGRDSPVFQQPVPVTQTVTIKAAAFSPAGVSVTSTATWTRRDGVAAALRPDAQPLAESLQLWLAADVLSGTVADGDPVATWTAARGPDAVVPPARLYSGLAPAPPAWSSRAINGRPAMRFDGVDDQLSIAGFANEHVAGTAFTILMVTQSPAGAFGICGNSSNGNGGIPRLYLTRNTFRYDVLDRGLGPHVLDGMPAISTFCHDGRETIAAYVNGQSQGQQSGLPVVAAFGGGSLSMPFWGGNQNQAGDIGEIVVFDRQLTSAERQSVEAYLAEKYAIRYQQKWR
jgi:hypothetical protein